MADCGDHVKGDIVDGVGRDVSGGVGHVEASNGGFEEEKKIVLRSLLEMSKR